MAVLGPGLVIVAISALLLRAYHVVSFWKATCLVGASVAVAVMARVVVETGRDPTSHNLWPFEIIIALMVGFVCAAPGALTGSLIARFLTNRRPGGES